LISIRMMIYRYIVKYIYYTLPFKVIITNKTHHYLRELFIFLMVEEALEIPEGCVSENDLPRAEKIRKLSEYLSDNRIMLRKNSKVTIRYYGNNAENTTIETDTARGREITYVPENKNKEPIVFIIDKDGNACRYLKQSPLTLLS